MPLRHPGESLPSAGLPRPYGLHATQVLMTNIMKGLSPFPLTQYTMNTAINSITITPTLLHREGHPQSYLAVSKVSGFPNHVKTIQPTRMAALTACSLLAEARESMKQRRTKAIILVTCGCS